MSRVLWVLNLDAELELQAGLGYNRSARMERIRQRLLPAARRLLSSGDMSLEEYDGSVVSATRCWCPTPSALKALSSLGLEAPRAPPLDVLRLANHRQFCHAVGGGGLAASWVTSSDELESLVRGDWHSWVLKRPLGMAGRGRRRIRPSPTPTDTQWLSASFGEDGLLAERWLDALAEYSIHGYLWEGGASTLGRPCRQYVDAHGSFTGCDVARQDDLSRAEHLSLVGSAERVASALEKIGYFGPFGVDAYRGVDPAGRVHFVACSEINARYTMSYRVGLPEAASAT